MAIHFHKSDLPADVTFGESVAVDTETMGLNPLRDRLCLVQLSSGDGSAHLVQIMPGQDQAPNLKKLMEDQAVVKLFHFARFDVAVLKHNLGIAVSPLYCTKIVSKLVRTYTDRHGLKDLCAELINVELSKQQQSSNWGAEVLSDQQKAYAASDVLYLHALKDRLDKMLDVSGRAHFAQQCFDFLATRADLDLGGWGETDIFAH